MQAISADPMNRPASALEMAAQLPGTGRGVGHQAQAAPARRWIGTRTWLAGAAVIVVAGVAAVISSYFVGGRGSALTEQDTIVLADFENTTGDPIFEGTLKVALAVALEQSPFLRVFPDDRARETLRLMQRPPDTRVTTTPAWTILLTRAAAVITDGGTLAAHASLIAREYAIPAVVATGDATRRLTNGQTVTVDGTTGTITPT